MVLQIDERRTTLQYTCFFDESFHDRKIVVNQSGEINTIKNDGIDNYIGVFWGCKTFNLSENAKNLIFCVILRAFRGFCVRIDCFRVLFAA